MNNDKLTVSNLVERAASPTPSFWKKIQKYALIAGAVAGTILTGGIAVPALVTTIAGYVAAVSGTVVTVAQLTKDVASTPDDGSTPAAQ